MRRSSLRSSAAWVAVALSVGCGPRSGADAGADAAAGADSGSLPGFDSGTAPGTDASTTCFEPPLDRALAILTAGGADFSTADGWAVLSGTTPATVAGAPTGGVTVNGSSTGVSFDPASGRWSWAGAVPAGATPLAVRAIAGASAEGPVTITVTQTGPAPADARATFGPGVHLVGAWMFPWFTGDTSWECGSPWWPVDGFAAWDGSPGWARGQLLDQMDAGLDFVGLQYDTKDASVPWGARWTNVANVFVAYRALLDEGYRPPALAMFLDTAIVNQLELMLTGAGIDVSTPAGRDTFYQYVDVFYAEAEATLGPRWIDAALAAYDGRPMLAFWHTDTGSIAGADDAFVLDLKARFMADRGVEPYVVAHPNFWSNWPSVDEITLMFGPPAHYYSGGWDGAGLETVNITPGFWNPTSNPWYLPREGGVSYDAAWSSAFATRATVEHLYIDSWNETGEGSGIFEALPTSYAAGDTGSCGTFVYPHAESWGPTSRHYIDTTGANAALWNDLAADDAELVAADWPTTMSPGERRLVTLVVRNTGDRAWTASAGDELAVVTGAGLVSAAAVPLDDARDDIPAFGGLFRGRPRAFTFEVVAPCEPGTHALALRMRRGDGTPFGATFSASISVP